MADYLILFIDRCSPYSFCKKLQLFLFFVFEYLLDPKHGMITFLFVIYCPLSYRDNRETTKVVFPTFIKKTPAARQHKTQNNNNSTFKRNLL